MNSTLWRKLSYAELSLISLNGVVLDLGGSRKSGYQELFQGNPTFHVVNIDKEYGYDFNFDLEKPFPIESEKYDAVCAINTIEHVFHYQNLLKESFRTMKAGGALVIAVPFLMQVHPCPHDYWRFTEETLEKIVGEAGFRDVQVKAIGRGPFTAGSHLRFNGYYFGIFRVAALFLSRIADAMIGRMSKNFQAKYYPLGYVVTAKK